MKDIPGIDEDGNPKNGPFKLFFKNGLVSCQGEFDNGKKSGKWKYFLNNGQMQSSGSFKDGKIVGRWKWFYKTGEPRATGGFDDEEQKHGAWKRYHPMANSGTKVASNTARKRALGRFTMSRANSSRRKLSSSGAGAR